MAKGPVPLACLTQRCWVLSFGTATAQTDARSCHVGKNSRSMLQELEATAVPTNIVTYNAVLSACEKGEQWLKILQLLEEMGRKKMLPDSFSYSASISGCGRCEPSVAAAYLFFTLGFSTGQ